MNLGKIKKRLRFLGPRSRSITSSSSNKVRDIVPFLMGELEALHERNAELQADCNLLREANWVAYREYEILENKHGTLMRKHQKRRESDVDYHHHPEEEEDWGSFPSFDSNNSQDFAVSLRVPNLLGVVVEEGEDEEGSNSNNSRTSSSSSNSNTRLVRQGSGDSKKEGSQVTETTTTTTRSQDSMATVSTKADSPKNGQHNDNGDVLLLSEADFLRRQLYETQLTKDKILIQLAELRSDYVDVTKTLQCSLRNMEVISRLHKKHKRERRREEEEESIRSRQLLENQQQQQSAHHEALSSVSAQLEQETNRIGRLREVLWEQMGIHLEDLERSSSNNNNGEGGTILMYSEKRHTEALDALRLVHEKEMDRLRKAHRIEMERVRLTTTTRGVPSSLDRTTTTPTPTHRSELLALHTTLDDKDKEIQRLQVELGRALKNLMSLSTELDRLRGLHECCSDDNTYVDDNSFVNDHDHHNLLAESLSFSSLDRTRDIFLQDLHTSMKSLDPQGVSSPPNTTTTTTNNNNNNNNRTGHHHRHDHQRNESQDVYAPSFESPRSGLSAREGSTNALDTTMTTATDQDFIMAGGESGCNPASPAPQPSPLGHGCLLNNNNNNNNKEPTVIHNSTPVISNRVVKSIPTTATEDKQLPIKPLAEEEEEAAATEEQEEEPQAEEEEQEQDVSSMKELVFGPHLTEVHVTPMDDDSDLSVTNRSWSTRDSSEAILHEVGKDEILGVKQNSMDTEEEEAAAATGEIAASKTKSTTESLIDYWSSLATKEAKKNGAALEGTSPPSVDADLTSSIARRLAQDIGSDDADTINDATHQIQVDLAITEMTLRSMEADLSHFSLSSYPPEMLRTPRNEQGMLLVDTPRGKSSADASWMPSGRGGHQNHHHHNNNQHIDFSDDAEPTSTEILKRVVSLTRSPTRGRNKGQQLRNGITRRPMAQLPNALPRNLLLEQHRKALDAIIFEDASASDSAGSNQSSYKTTHSTENAGLEGSDPSALIGRTFFAV